MTDQALDTATTDTVATTQDAPPPAAGDKAPAADAKPNGAAGKDAQPAAEDGKGKTIAAGADAETEDQVKEEAAGKAADDKPYWPKDWREKAAEHYAAGDKKAYARELKRLERITDPVGVYGMYRELESKFTSGGIIKIPGKDAKPEEVAEFHKALGVPEKPEGYIEHIKLESGAVIGDADKPFLNDFTQTLHKAGAPPSTANAAVNWYYKVQEEQAAALDEADDTFRRDSERALKDEYGNAFKRKIGAIPSLFATAPGGPDIKNPQSAYARLMGSRTPDGKIVGNDPDLVKFFVDLGLAVNPERAATVTEDGRPSGKSIDQELAEIDKLRRTDRPAYNKDRKMQERERELIEAQLKSQARNRA